ncbi:hypothetical protein L1I30_12115 [Gillisia sp. M10.2A]|uniref:Lipoprotein n=1 Tax=Gillisia lutea TaxID=2909668 RepID=A0ABS9EJQ3_9FLAO|nr:hypothetical protein [Gillisia lutea]MCF4102414.1 hypothetical protein [Gillisia lutea]
MKKIISALIVLLVLTSCKDNNAQQETVKENITTPLAITQQIANANGYENFKDISELNFTFNVKVNDTLRANRSWKWLPKENKIRLIEGQDTISYIKSEELNEKALAVDQKFINDSYWLLFPFQLVWSNFEMEESGSVTSPISKAEMKSLAIKYTNNGGYTPGDTYYIYYSDDLMVKEWTYQSSGGRSLSTTWEDYTLFKGIPIAQMHKSEDGSFQLYFTDISVK